MPRPPADAPDVAFRCYCHDQGWLDQKAGVFDDPDHQQCNMMNRKEEYSDGGRHFREGKPEFPCPYQ
jgi:hypothetical protein